MKQCPCFMSPMWSSLPQTSPLCLPSFFDHCLAPFDDGCGPGLPELGGEFGVRAPWRFTACQLQVCSAQGHSKQCVQPLQWRNATFHRHLPSNHCTPTYVCQMLQVPANLSAVFCTSHGICHLSPSFLPPHDE